MTTSTQKPTLTKVTSRDGTEIGYGSSGEGPPLVLIHGILGDHTRWAAMLPYLEPHFTVHAMDRRGRGASGDHPDYDIAREFEDVAAVVDDVAEGAGTGVDVLGSSGGAAYAIAAASLTPNIRRLVLFEPPTAAVLNLLPPSLTDRMDELLAAGEREAVLELAYRAVVGLSEPEIEHLRNQPAWSSRVAAAHTVPRELRSPPDRLFDSEQAARVATPTLLLAGGASPQPFQESAGIVAETLPNARVEVLDAQGHAAEMLAPEIVAERVLDFLTEPATSSETFDSLPEPEAQMNHDRIHRALSTDGIDIVGRVRGQGPALVLVHGGLGDGDSSWGALLPHLTEEFTCYMMSTRGVGLSAEPPVDDYSIERHVDDVVAFSESIGEPVVLLGYSLGGALSLGAAARSNAISAVAVYEPALFEVPSSADPSSAEQKVARIMEAVAGGRLALAARAMIEDVATEHELARLSEEGFFELVARNVPVAVRVMQQASTSAGPTPTDAAGLARIQVPVLYMHGSETRSTWYIDGAEYVREHANTVRVVEITGGGHFAPRFVPDEIARALIGLAGGDGRPLEAGAYAARQHNEAAH